QFIYVSDPYTKHCLSPYNSSDPISYSPLSDLLFPDLLLQPGQYMAHHKKDGLVMDIIQDIFVPHKLQHCREFFIRIPELEDCGQERKNLQPIAYISCLLRDPSQFF